MAGSERESHEQLSDEALMAIGDAEFDAMTAEVRAVLGAGPTAIEPEVPSASLWDAIAAEVAADAEQNVETAHGPAAISTTPDYGITFDPLGHGPASGPAGYKARSRWGGRTALITLAAAACLLVAVPVGLALTGGGDEPVEIAASADLNVIPGVETARPGHADLVIDGSVAELDLDIDALPAEGEYLELWLLELDEANQPIDMVSLGEIDGSGTYTIPAGVDRDRFTVVDISTEAHDGNGEHSGNSLLRGALSA